METPMDYEMGYSDGFQEGKRCGNTEAWQDFAIELDEFKKRNELLDKRIKDAFSVVCEIKQLSQTLFTILYQPRE